MADDNDNRSSSSFFGNPSEEIDSRERRYGKEFFGNTEADITENRNFLEQKRIDEALRDAKPSFLKDGLGIRGPLQNAARTEDEVRRTDFGNGSVVRPPITPPFPGDPSGSEAQIDATKVDVYGAVNGAPGVFHLYQSSPPTPL